MSASRKVLSLKEKIDIINMVESNEFSARDIRTKYQIGKTQTYQILSRKDEYQAQFSKGPKAKFKNSSNVEINTRVWNWFVESKANNIPVNGPMVQKQARKIAKQLGYDGFRASNGWLQCFKIRHNIRFSIGVDKDDATRIAPTKLTPIRITAVQTCLNADYETIVIEESDGERSSFVGEDDIEIKNEICFEDETVLENRPFPFDDEGGMRSDACRNYQDVLDCIHRLQSFSVMNGDSRLLEMSTEMRNYVERNIYGE